jgi:hypothetical protein
MKMEMGLHVLIWANEVLVFRFFQTMAKVKVAGGITLQTLLII